MAWRDTLQPGSFRGVPFEVESHNHSTGRRGQLHEYPFRDQPFFEDLGRKTREFTIDVFLIGDFYAGQRDALLAACEQSGAGTLIHPYLGSKQVVCTNCTVSERIDEGRVCRFSLTFVDAGARLFPSGTADLSASVSGLAGLASAASVLDFTGLYSAAGLPGFVFDSVGSAAGRFISLLNGFGAVDDFLDIASDYESEITSLMISPQAFAERTIDLITSLRDTLQPSTRDSKSAALAATAMKQIGAFSTLTESSGIQQTTQNRVAQANNLQAFESLVRRGALLNEAKTIPAVSLDSYQAAISYARDYVDRIDSELLRTESQNSYLPLTNLASTVSKELNTKAGGLPQIASKVLPETTPSLVMAYEQYADAKRAADIERRNSIRNPSFMPAGVPLEVLTA